MDSASAVSFSNQETTDNFNSVFNYLKNGEEQKLNTTIAPGSSRLVDLNNLFLNYDSDVSMTFLGEGTVKENDLSYNVNGGNSTNIWENISAVENSDADFLRNPAADDPTDGTMNFGDSMTLGSFGAGDQFEFLLTPEWSRGQGNSVTYSSITANSINGDGLQHAIGYALDDRYMILGFEDLYGEHRVGRNGFNENSDRDLNDVLLLVDMGEGNLASVPEPATASALFAAGALGLFGVRRRKNS
ncbi:MAG: PEP-CTERM sorting domain-containing protein [Microcoleaceae cyanobacterium]